MNQRRKYYLDNLIWRFTKRFVKCIYIFLNKKISNFKCSNERLLRISHKNIFHFYRESFYKKIGEIFSNNIDPRYLNHPQDHNRKLIEKLCNETNDDVKKIFNALFILFIFFFYQISYCFKEIINENTLILIKLF